MPQKIDVDKYYRHGSWNHFSKDIRCYYSMTARVDATDLAAVSKRSQTRFYLNFLFVLTKTLNSREEYRMHYDWQTDEVLLEDTINPTQYVFFPETELCTPVYSLWSPDYGHFYESAATDIRRARERGTYEVDMESHPNWFDASYLPWISYDAFHLELPDGFTFYEPILNWGRWRIENGRKMMPVTIRLNHAVADGWLCALFYKLLEQEMEAFASSH